VYVEWDEDKRRSNLDKHGLDFVRAADMLSGVHVVIPSLYEGDEPRWLAVGVVEARLVTLVFTLRGDRHRIISLRRARHDERRIYEDLLG
jgi:uncharacterized DUF497 family protein